MCLGIPGRIVTIWEDQGTRMADVDFGGATKDVCLAYLPDAQIGDYTIVHAGFGLTKLDEASALETLAMFQDLGMLEDELGIPSQPSQPSQASQPSQPSRPGAPSASKTGASQTDSAQTDTTQTDTAQTDTAQTDTAPPRTSQAGAAR